jgi:prepilin-type N-terminal cleavage/methylation domain-containing protein
MKLSQMQALKSQKGGFTLVELIVVITILAILATVGFLSYQGYTKDAKSAKVRENIGLITSKMSELGAAGADMTTLVSTGVDRTFTLSGTKTAYGNTGGTAYTLKAGNVNWTTVTGLNSADMTDVNDEHEPLVGVISTSGHSALQAASTIKVNEVDTIYVKGNFTPDGTDPALYAQGLIATSSTGTHTGNELTDKTEGNHFTY